MAPVKQRVWDKFKDVAVDGVKKGKCKACVALVVNNHALPEKHWTNVPQKEM